MLQEAPSQAQQTFEPPRARIDFERILRRQGYRHLDQVSPALRQAAEHAASLLGELHEPWACYRRFAIRSCDAGQLQLEGGMVFRCNAFSKYLDSCSHAVLFVITAGRNIDEKVVELARDGHMPEAFLLEVAGSLAVDDSTSHLKRHIAREAAHGAGRIGMRMGPGYSYQLGNTSCMWPLEDQSPLFEALGERALRVELTPAWLMFPKLSRSGLYGEGRRLG